MADGNGKDEEFVVIPLIQGGGNVVKLADISRGEVETGARPCTFCFMETKRVIAAKRPQDGPVWTTLVPCCDHCFKAIRKMPWEFKGG